MSIIIYSKSIHSGKTQSLLTWCETQTNVSGILMPIVNDKRFFYNIKTKTNFEAEVNCLYKDEVWQIGKYLFSQQAFGKANEIIRIAITENADCVVIDELGFLELEGKGFYDSWQFAMQAIKNQQFTGKLVLVVRDSLLKDVVLNLQNLPYKVVDDLQYI